MKKKNTKKYDFRFEIANLITEVRYHYNLTQAQLAMKMKTKQPSIARVESGSILPSLTFIENLAEAVGTYVIAPKFGFMDRGNKVEKVTSEKTRTIRENIEQEIVIPSSYYKIETVNNGQVVFNIAD